MTELLAAIAAATAEAGQIDLGEVRTVGVATTSAEPA